MALLNMPGIGSKSALRLTGYAGSATNVLQMSEAEVADVLGSKLAKRFLEGREHIGKEPYLKKLENLKIDFIPFTVADYPHRLKNISDPPFGLYVKGELPENDVPTVAIIGARACSEYGKTIAYMFGKQLGAFGIQIVSGMARGIDGIAQRGALDGDGKTFAVLGCGVDYCYPPENGKLYRDIIENGGILSEYSPGTEPKHHLFPARNRIISGLADVILVVEARKRSGTYITVTQALEQNKDVYAVPGRITDSLSDGCNHLLSQGAGVAISPEMILRELGNSCYNGWSLKNNDYRKTEKTKEDLQMYDVTDEKGTAQMETLILSCLEITPMDIGTIYERVYQKKDITMEEMMVILTKLQILGKVENSGNYYRLSFAL